MKIDNNAMQSFVKVDGQDYRVCTYIGNRHACWVVPWVTWIIRWNECYGTKIYEKRIEKHTLEAAEESHKWALGHAEEIIRERETAINATDF